MSLVDRDWQAVERVKTEFRLEQKAALTPGAALRLGDELRRYVRAVRPDWPDAAEREADLATHARVSEGPEACGKPRLRLSFLRRFVTF